MRDVARRYSCNRQACGHPFGDRNRELLERLWPTGVVDLSLSLQVGRVFPMLKLALGHAKACRRVRVDGREVDVVKRAA